MRKLYFRFQLFAVELWIYRLRNGIKMAKQFTLEEVKKHNTAKDLWFTIHDKVYDVTKFIEEVSVSDPKIKCADGLRVWFITEK